MSTSSRPSAVWRDTQDEVTWLRERNKLLECKNEELEYEMYESHQRADSVEYIEKLETKVFKLKVVVNKLKAELARADRNEQRAIGTMELLKNDYSRAESAFANVTMRLAYFKRKVREHEVVEDEPGEERWEYPAVFPTGWGEWKDLKFAA
jgi:hypothetical protein